MTFDEYQEQASRTAHFEGDCEGLPSRNYGIMYCALGLGGEAGEALEKVKKLMRDNNGVLTDERRFMIESEIGDVLWYAAMLSDQIGSSLGEAAENNLRKIASRSARNMIHGDGDTR